MTPTTPKRLLLAALLAAASAFAVAQTPAPAASATPAAGEHHAQRDPAQRHQRMAEHHAQRQAELKAQLKLTPAQEGAWTTYTAALKREPRQPRADRAEFEKLTTPQRIDRLQSLQAERQQRMAQRGEVVKTFYAQLAPEQQKVYDQQTLRRHAPGQRHGKPHHGPHGPAAR